MKGKIIILLIFVALSIVMVWQKNLEFKNDPSVEAFKSTPQLRQDFNQLISVGDDASWVETKAPSLGIEFKHPADFVFQPGVNGGWRFSRSDRPNVFSTSIQLEKKAGWQNYVFEPVFYGGGKLSYNAASRRWEYATREAVSDQSQFTVGQTIDGHDIFLFLWGDAGGLARVYIIPVEEDDAVLEVWAGSDENAPNNQRARINQIQQDFNQVAAKIVSSIKLDK